NRIESSDSGSYVSALHGTEARNEAALFVKAYAVSCLLASQLRILKHAMRFATSFVAAFVRDAKSVFNDILSIGAADDVATTNHRAVIEISRIATRWHEGLADDCHNPIDLQTSKLVRLEDLHHFPYGRGGRVEGIASIEETSKFVRHVGMAIEGSDLARRNKESTMLRQSSFHTRWWTNALFAWHAGIIDVDTIGGRICHE
ncbi:hypothetical protein PSPO01_16198, partial [Paraphaeosphaeria sporulosa]